MDFLITCARYGLLLHALVVGVELGLADAETAACPARSDDGDAQPTADIGLFGLVVVGVLQALQRQVAPYVGGDFRGVDLGPFKRRVPPAEQGRLIAGVQCGFGPGRAVAFLVAGTLVGIGEDAETGTFGTYTNAGADGAAAAAVLAIELLRIGSSLKLDVAFGGQQQVIAGLELTALYPDKQGLKVEAGSIE